MSTKSREVIWGSQIRGAKMTAEHARLRATEAVREADRAEAYAWSVRARAPGNASTAA
jgi:hypothetical protein